MEHAKYDIFISYSRTDKNVVSKFVENFEKAGYKVWIDAEGIYSGVRFKKVLVKAIEDSSVFIFFSSEKSNSSPWTAKEIGIAVNRKKTIIPVKIDNSRYNEEVEFDIINLDHVDYYSKNKRKRETERLMLTLSVLLKTKQESSTLQDKQDTIKSKSLHKINFRNKGCAIAISVYVTLLVVFVFSVVMLRTDDKKDMSFVEKPESSSVLFRKPPGSAKLSSPHSVDIDTAALMNAIIKELKEQEARQEKATSSVNKTYYKLKGLVQNKYPFRLQFFYDDNQIKGIYYNDYIGISSAIVGNKSNGGLFLHNPKKTFMITMYKQNSIWSGYIEEGGVKKSLVMEQEDK